MREDQVKRLTRLMLDRDDAEWWDEAALGEAGIVIDTKRRAQNLLQAAILNSSLDEAAEATRRWASGHQS